MAAIVISVASTKGGCGKTHLCKEFARLLSKQGKRVLIIDLCQNSDIATRLGWDRKTFQFDTFSWVAERIPWDKVVTFDEESEIYFIPASNRVDLISNFAKTKLRPNLEYFVLKDKLEDIKYRFDYIFFDNHPTEFNSLMQYSFVASDLIFMPTTMDPSSIQATERCVEIVSEVKALGYPVPEHLYAIPFAVDLNKGHLKHLKILEEEFSKKNIPVTHPIRHSSAVNSQYFLGNIFNSENKWLKKVEGDYNKISKEIFPKFVPLARAKR